MKARIRVICTLTSICFPALAGCALEPTEDASENADGVSQGLASDSAVYTNAAPASGWHSWSWSSTVALANADAPLTSGSSGQIKVTVNTAGGALSLAHGAADLDAADYDAISFDVRAPSPSSLRLAVESLAGAASGASATIPVTTSWTRQTVKLGALRGSLVKFGKVDWIASQSGQTFYVDNVTLVGKAAGSPPPPPPASSTTFPVAPLTVKKSDVVALRSSAGPYSLYVPSSYDASHNTPTKVLLWLHGCGGNAYGDAWATSPGGAQSWISVSVGGRDGACWNVNSDVPLVLAALDDIERRLNVDSRRVVVGGYSSGGDMAYRTAFTNAKRFAGVIGENSTPFRDTVASQSAAISGATWRLNIAHLAHVSDSTYPIGTVRRATDALKTAGFPVTRIERAGTHWDADTTSSGTNHDLRAYLLRYLDAGWVAP